MKTTLLPVIGLLLVTASPFFSQAPQRKSTPQLFPIVDNEGYGFIDRTGRMIIAPHFRGGYFMEFSEGLAAVKIDGQWCYIDETGKVAIRTSGFDSAGPFTEGLAFVGVNKRIADGVEKMTYGYIDRSGRVVIPPQYDETYGFSEGLGRVVVNGKWGFIDKTGQMVIEPQFIIAYWFSEGFASVALESVGQVYIDHTGKIVSNPEYQYADAWFSEGLTPAAKGSKWGFVDKNFRMVIEPLLTPRRNASRRDWPRYELMASTAISIVRGRWLFLRGSNSRAGVSTTASHRFR